MQIEKTTKIGELLEINALSINVILLVTIHFTNIP